MLRNNKHRNRNTLIKADLTCAIGYRRFKFREHRKNVFNASRERIRKNYLISDDLN